MKLSDRQREVGAAGLVIVLLGGAVVSPFPGDVLAIGMAILIAREEGWLDLPQRGENDQT